MLKKFRTTPDLKYDAAKNTRNLYKRGNLLSKQDPSKLCTRIGKLTSISGKGILILESIISQLYALRKST